MHNKITSFIFQAINKETDECIIWPFSISNGYAKLWHPIEKKIVNAGSYILEVTKGPKPDGMEMTHSCHVRACINKRHLFWKTHLQNEMEKNNAGRGRKGKCELPREAIIFIRSSNLTTRELGSKFGVSSMHISRIKRGLNGGEFL